MSSRNDELEGNAVILPDGMPLDRQVPPDFTAFNSDPALFEESLDSLGTRQEERLNGFFSRQPIPTAKEILGFFYDEIAYWIHMRSMLDVFRNSGVLNQRKPEGASIFYTQNRQKIDKGIDEFLLDKRIQAAMTEIQHDDEWKKLDQVTQDEIRRLLAVEMKVLGPNLSDEQKGQLCQKKDQLAKLVAQFSDDLTGRKKVQLELPDGAIRPRDPWEWDRVLRWDQNSTARQMVWEAAFSVPENAPNLTTVLEILRIRAQIAALLGFGSYAEVAFANNGVVGDPKVLLDSYKEQAKTLLPEAQKEYAALQGFCGGEVNLADARYAKEQYLRENGGVSLNVLLEGKMTPRSMMAAIQKIVWGEALGIRSTSSEIPGRQGALFLEWEGWNGGGVRWDGLRAADKRKNTTSTPSFAYQGADGRVHAAVVDVITDLPSEPTATHLKHLLHEMGHATGDMGKERRHVPVAGFNGSNIRDREFMSKLFEKLVRSGRFLEECTEGQIDQEALKQVKENPFETWEILARIVLSIIDLELNIRVPSDTAELKATVERIVSNYFIGMPVHPDEFLSRSVTDNAHCFEGPYAAVLSTYAQGEWMVKQVYPFLVDDAGNLIPQRFQAVVGCAWEGSLDLSGKVEALIAKWRVEA